MAGGSSNNDTSSFSSSSFMWPPGGSDPSDGNLPVPSQFKSINPLANAIDLRSTRTTSQDSQLPSATAAGSKWKVIQQAIELRSARTTSQDSLPSATAAGAKWKVIQQAIKSNVQELKAKVQQGSEGGSGVRAQGSITPAEAAAQQPEAVERISDSGSDWAAE